MVTARAYTDRRQYQSPRLDRPNVQPALERTPETRRSPREIGTGTKTSHTKER